MQFSVLIIRFVRRGSDSLLVLFGSNFVASILTPSVHFISFCAFLFFPLLGVSFTFAAQSDFSDDTLYSTIYQSETFTCVLCGYRADYCYLIPNSLCALFRFFFLSSSSIQFGIQFHCGWNASDRHCLHKVLTWATETPLWVNKDILLFFIKCMWAQWKKIFHTASPLILNTFARTNTCASISFTLNTEQDVTWTVCV